jgi:hypothetical protein
MLEQIAKGEADVEVMVKEARGALRKKEPQLREALAGVFVYRVGLPLNRCRAAGASG